MSHPSHVALSELSVAAINVRRSGRGSEPIFAGSIRENGVIEPLIARLNGDGYTITNGSKRYDALCWLRDNKGEANGIPVTNAFPVPVVIRDEVDADARKTSLITNVVRADMHPVDEYRAFAQMLKDGSDRADICAEFAMTTKQLDQVLALAKLSPTIQDAWLAGKIDADRAQAFTLAPDHKSQDALYAKLSKRDPDWRADDVAEELKIKGDIGKMLEFVGVEAYEGRKGKATLDLFGTNHRVSDEKLLKAMVGETMDARAERLKAAGWSFAIIDAADQYSFGRIQPNARPTKEEKERMEALEAQINSESLSPDEQDTLQIEYDAIESAVLERAFTAEQRAKSGCLLSFTWQGFKIEYGRVKPEEKKKVDAQERAAERKKKVKAATKNGEPVPAGLSNALTQRLSEQLTRAVSKTIAADVDLGLAALLAGFVAGDVVVVSERGLDSKRAQYSGRKSASFDSALKLALDLPRDLRLKRLAEIAGAAIDMETFRSDQPPLKSKANVALIDALKPDVFAKAMREAFDAKDYFGNVSKPLCLKAITEAINADEARKVSGKPKGDIAKFAIANCARTGWLPPELRTSAYDGPAGAAKGKTAKAPKAKATGKPKRKAA